MSGFCPTGFPSMWGWNAEIAELYKFIFLNSNILFKRFCWKIYICLHSAIKWINLSLITTGNKLFPGRFVVWNRSCFPRMGSKTGSFVWNSSQMKLLPENFHAASLKGLSAIDACFFPCGLRDEARLGWQLTCGVVDSRMAACQAGVAIMISLTYFFNTSLKIWPRRENGGKYCWACLPCSM